MEFIADEGVERQIVDRLRSDGHTVLYIAESAPRSDDADILAEARQNEAVLITADKDFGEMVFRQYLLHTGVILLRLYGLPNEDKAAKVAAAVLARSEEMKGAFTVISPRMLRIRRRESLS